MTAAAHVQAAIDELDAESSELRLLDEVAEQRSALVAWLRHVEQRDRVEPPAQASPRDTPDPASPAGPTATAGVPGPSGGTPATIESGRASESRTTTSPGEGAGRPTSARSARPAAPKSHKGGRRNRSDLGEVARVAREALAAGRPMRDAVAAHLGCGPSGAGQAITKARKAGHDIPPAPSGQAGAKLRKLSARPAPNADDLPAVEQRPVSSWSPKPGENVVVCDECGHVEPITGVSALNRHCLSQHRRAATVEERTPRPWEEQAA